MTKKAQKLLEIFKKHADKAYYLRGTSGYLEIRDTGIPALLIIQLFNTASQKEILESYPSLFQDDLDYLIKYYEEYRPEIETAISLLEDTKLYV